MTTVDKIIYNALMAGGVVRIPEVGTLGIISSSATKGADGKMLPPHKELKTLSSTDNSVTVAELISEVGGVGAEQAERIYAEWYAGAVTAKGLRIAGVGLVATDGSGVVVDDDLAAKLNPVAPERRYGISMKWLWLLLLIVVGVGSWWTYSYWGSIKARIWGDGEAAQTEVETEVVAMEPNISAPIAEGVPLAEGDQSGYHVIVGVFDVESNADRLVNRMAEAGFPSTYKFIPGRARFFVTVGRFFDREDAEFLKREVYKVVRDVWVYPYHVDENMEIAD